MFTGIVAHCGEITAVERSAQGLRLQVSTLFSDLQEGESIAVDGVCLTIVNPSNHCFYCDVSAETCALTTINEYRVGRTVNLERALLASDRFGGHYVTGHVERVATVADISFVGDCTAIAFTHFPEKMMSYLIHKGSVCVNGVSLTINRVLENGFEVMLIPHTLEKTNLHALDVGSKVNIEFDWMVKVILTRLANENIPNEVRL